MAIPIKGYTVVARLDRLQHLLDAKKVTFPNSTILNDENLWRCSFMTEDDASKFANSLELLGLNISKGPDSDVVLVNEFDLNIAPYCEWLHATRWEKAVIAWLAGTEPLSVVTRDGWDPKVGSGLNFRTSTDGLEFVRLEGNVEVYRDIATGELVYIGRTSAPIESLFRSAAKIILKHLRSPGEQPVEGSQAIEVADAVAMLDKVLSETAGEWRVHWIHGKGHLALGNVTRAYESFHRAYDIEKSETAIVRELAGTCLVLGKFDEGLEVAEQAAVLAPDNHELIGNLAIAHLLAGNVTPAQRTIEAAQKLKPNDETNKHLSTIINDVVAGRRRQPRSIDDLHHQSMSRHNFSPQNVKKKFWQFWKK